MGVRREETMKVTMTQVSDEGEDLPLVTAEDPEIVR